MSQNKWHNVAEMYSKFQRAEYTDFLQLLVQVCDMYSDFGGTI